MDSVSEVSGHDPLALSFGDLYIVHHKEKVQRRRPLYLMVYRSQGLGKKEKDALGFVSLSRSYIQFANTALPDPIS